MTAVSSLELAWTIRPKHVYDLYAGFVIALSMVLDDKRLGTVSAISQWAKIECPLIPYCPGTKYRRFRVTDLRE